MTEQIRRNEKSVDDPAAAVEADEGELVIEAYALRCVISQGQTEEEEAGQESEEASEGGYRA